MSWCDDCGEPTSQIKGVVCRDCHKRTTDTIDALRVVADAAAEFYNHSRLIEKMTYDSLQHLATVLRDAGYDDLVQAYYEEETPTEE